MENLHNVVILINYKLKLVILGKICNDVFCLVFVKIDPNQNQNPYFTPDITQPWVALTNVTTLLVI